MGRTVRRAEQLGPGDYYLAHPGAEWEEASPFRARELFVDALQDVAPEKCEHLREVVNPTVQQVFDARGNLERLECILEDRGLAWDWPPKEWPKYGDAFHGWPPPTPEGTAEMPLGEMYRIVVTRFNCWQFHGWLIPTLLRDDLDAWSSRWNLTENPWVAGHFLARMCKARFLTDGQSPTEPRKLDHTVFPSPGVLAWFGDSLVDHFHIPGGPKSKDSRFRQWDPTQEAWSEWQKAAKDVFAQALQLYKARVLEECETRSIRVTPKPRHLERNLRRLVGFQVLGKTHEELRSEGEYDVKAVQKAIARTSVIVGLKLRTSSSASL
jgi:hypothetical protein